MLINIWGLTNWLELTLVAFGCYRLALMVSTETGAFGIFDRLRGAIAKRFPGKPIMSKDGAPSGYYRQHWLTEGVNCPLCVGFWLSPICVAMWISGQVIAQGLLAWLAIAGMQTFLTKVSSNDK